MIERGRVQRHHLPGRETPCPRTDCVYNGADRCANPCLHKGNGDAECHRWPNRRLLEVLGLPIPASVAKERP